MHFSYFKQAIDEVRLDEAERELYGNWVGLGLHGAITRGVQSKRLSQKRVNLLADHGDPAAFIVERLNFIQKTDFPSLEREPRLYDLTFGNAGACAIFLASIHGKPTSNHKI